MFLKVGDLAARDHAVIRGMRDRPNCLFHCACAILIDPPNILSFGVTSLYMGSSLSRIQAIIYDLDFPRFPRPGHMHDPDDG